MTLVLASILYSNRPSRARDAIAKSIQLITEQMTPEYARYLSLTQWDGLLPSTLLGSGEELGIIINTE